jgi:FkbM family methyltransferase
MLVDNFIWGDVYDIFKKLNTEEFNLHKIYEKFFTVEEGDIVVDIGASIGPFTYSILKNKPKHCWVVEPLDNQFEVLKQNLMGNPVSFIKAAITDVKNVKIEWDGNIAYPRTLTFNELITENGLSKIDFLKIDCEGGEYDIFSIENIEFLKIIPKIVTEFHLGMVDDVKSSMILKSKFRYFRDYLLNNFNNFEVYSIDAVNIKWNLYNEHFLDYYKGVIIYIDNRL